MNYSIKHNLIFLHIPKCGGTSYLRNNRSIWESYTQGKIWHKTYLMTKEHFQDNEFFNNCNIYARIREPIPRMRSLFTYIRDIQLDHDLHNLANKISFSEFVKYVIDNFMPHYHTCYDFLKDENGEIPKRIKIEKLEEIKVEKISNSSNSNFEIDNTAEEMIREHFKKDYETWY